MDSNVNNMYVCTSHEESEMHIKLGVPTVTLTSHDQSVVEVDEIVVKHKLHKITLTGFNAEQ